MNCNQSLHLLKKVADKEKQLKLTIKTNFTIVYQIEMMNSHYAYQFIYLELAYF